MCVWLLCRYMIIRLRCLIPIHTSTIDIIRHNARCSIQSLGDPSLIPLFRTSQLVGFIPKPLAYAVRPLQLRCVTPCLCAGYHYMYPLNWTHSQSHTSNERMNCLRTCNIQMMKASDCVIPPHLRSVQLHAIFIILATIT